MNSYTSMPEGTQRQRSCIVLKYLETSNTDKRQYSERQSRQLVRFGLSIINAFHDESFLKMLILLDQIKLQMTT